MTSRLQTSKVNVETTTWYYNYDANGNLHEMTPNGSMPANGAIRYTYNGANQLNKIESHNGSAYVTLAQMAYDGLGSRVVLTGWVSGVAYTTTYASRIAGKVQILQATSGANTTSYVYGLNQVGEFGLQGVYYLTDDNGSIRHLVDPNGAVKLARMYEPFGQVLIQTGSGDPIYGYLGAQFDRISGLLYINGAYYDPVTGRFLSPSSGGSNPYVPLGGAALAPVLILALIGRRKKGKIWTGWVVIALMTSMGLSVTACGGSSTNQSSTPTRPNLSAIGISQRPTAISTRPATPGAPNNVPLTPVATICPKTAYVTPSGGSEINVRSGPTTQLARVGELPSGAQAEVIGQFGREAAGLWWWHIRYNNLGQAGEGWVRSDMVNIIGNVNFPAPKPWISPFGAGVGHKTLNPWCSNRGGTSDNICSVTENNPTGTGHNGIDLESDNDPGLDSEPTKDKVAGREVYAMADAVILSIPSQPDVNGNVSAYWINILHEHPNGNIYWLQYTHFQSAASGITAGNFLEQGTQLGYYSMVGKSDAPHLHVTIKPIVQDALGSAIDPTSLVP